jgi:hypothetical protein
MRDEMDMIYIGVAIMTILFLAWMMIRNTDAEYRKCIDACENTCKELKP